MKNKAVKYSGVLFSLTKEHNIVELSANQLPAIKYLYKNVPNFRLLFESKRIALDTKKQILKNVLASFNELLIEFLGIIIEHNSSKYLMQIIDKYLILAKKELYANEIEITSAENLDEKLKQSLAKQLDCSLKINVDSSMIGGIKLRKGNTIFDNSISFQLNQLKKTLYNM